MGASGAHRNKAAQRQAVVIVAVAKTGEAAACRFSSRIGHER